jgi:hypothetical protein
MNNSSFNLPVGVQSGIMTVLAFVYAAYENIAKAHPGAPEQYISAALALLFGLKHTSLKSTLTNLGLVRTTNGSLVKEATSGIPVANG